MLQVQIQLPAVGLDELLARPWVPLLNACRGPSDFAATPERPFPLWGIAQAPNAKSFLDVLGPPLAIAQDLESCPGIWWLATPAQDLECLVFSDVHRKRAWKGGQFCVRAARPHVWTLSRTHLDRVSQAFASVWGSPAPSSEADPADLQGLQDWSVWFARRVAEASIHWPRAEAARAMPAAVKRRV